MKLTELQSKITPGPLVVRGGNDIAYLCGQIPVHGDTDFIVSVRTGSDSTIPLAHYLAHCANHMPKVLEALRNVMQCNRELGTISRPIGMEARAAIAAAEEVEGI